VATEITRRLGVEPCFVITEWEEVTAGNWSDRWDISIGSMAITSERMKAVYFTHSYYTTPAAFFVHQDNTTFSQPGDLSGKRIGVCAGCTYEAFLDGSLDLPGQTVDFIVKNAIIIDYGTDTMALHDLSVGDGLQLDAVLTAEPNGQDLIVIGQPLKQLGEPVFYEYLAAAVDKQQRVDPLPLVKRVSAIIREMHADGTLQELSQFYFETDLTTKAAAFSASGIGDFK
jgi:polar amino acid transport system substrate-binding protein